MNAFRTSPSPPVLSLRSLQALADEFSRVAPSLPGAAMAVLLLGPRGANKQRLARLIHCAGPRRNEPFITVDCTPRRVGACSQGRYDLDVAGRGTLYLDHLSGSPPEEIHALIDNLQVGPSPKLIAGGDVQWSDARQDEAAVFWTPVVRLTSFLCWLGVTGETPCRPPRGDDPWRHRLPP